MLSTQGDVGWGITASRSQAHAADLDGCTPLTSLSNSLIGVLQIMSCSSGCEEMERLWSNGDSSA